jgi:hypothetical protein
MSNVIHHTQLTGSLGLTECKDGFWLYDTTRGMNLSMKAKTAEAAFVEALTYYQKKLTEVEGSLYSLQSKVQSFVCQFVADDDSDIF